jgi:formyltetrahydrofolate hydrolase
MTFSTASPLPSSESKSSLSHPTTRTLADSYKIPFYHFPVTADTKQEQKGRILELVKENDIDVMVVA